MNCLINAVINNYISLMYHLQHVRNTKVLVTSAEIDIRLVSFLHKSTKGSVKHLNYDSHCSESGTYQARVLKSYLAYI